MLSASEAARANATVLKEFSAGYGSGNIHDSGTDHLAQNALSGFIGSLDEYLLANWYSGPRSYDAVHVQSFSSTAQVCIRKGNMILKVSAA